MDKRLKLSSRDLKINYLLNLNLPKLKIDSSGINGNGLFAGELIKKGRIICPILGIIYDLNKSKIKYPKYSYQISDRLAIETINEPGYINHSCAPNAFLNDSWMFESIKDININEEVTIDYGVVDYFNYSFKCTCGSKKCRGRFNGVISDKKSFQKEKRKYFSPYLRERFLEI